MEHLVPDSPVAALASLMRGRRTLVLSGAGISTESGIPDYRGPRGTLRSRLPMRYREFVGSEEARRRYWSRGAVGWSRLTLARPNAGTQIPVSRCGLCTSSFRSHRTEARISGAPKTFCATGIHVIVTTSTSSRSLTSWSDSRSLSIASSVLAWKYLSPH